MNITSHNRYFNAISIRMDVLTPAQCRMARAALSLGVRELADAAKVSTNTVTRLERGEELRGRTVDAIRAALEHRGIEFLADGAASPAGGPGVRLRSM